MDFKKLPLWKLLAHNLLLTVLTTAEAGLTALMLLTTIFYEDDPSDYIAGMIIAAMFGLWTVISCGMLVRIGAEKEGALLTGFLMKATVFLAMLATGVTLLPPLVLGASITMGLLTVLAGIGTAALALWIRKETKKPVRVYHRQHFAPLRCDADFDKAAAEYLAVTGQTGKQALTPMESEAVLDGSAGRAAFFLVWLLRRQLLSPGIYEQCSPEQLEQAAQCPEDFLIHTLNGSLCWEHLSEDVAYFADQYLSEQNIVGPLNSLSERYLFDFFDAVCTKTGRNYCNAFSPELYAELEPLLDKRYQDYLQARAEDDDPAELQSISFHGAEVDVYAYPAEPKQIERCIQHFQNWDDSLRAEAVNMVQECFEALEDEPEDCLKLFSPTSITVFPGDEPAYIIDGETDLDEEHGFSMTIRGNRVLECGPALGCGSPYSDENERRVRIEESIGYKRMWALKTAEEADALVQQGLLVQTEADGQRIYLPPVVMEVVKTCEKKLNALQALGRCDQVKYETLFFRDGNHIVPSRLYISGNKEDKRIFFEYITI